MDLDINYERLLQISPKEINMYHIRGEHNPMNELVLPPIPPPRLPAPKLNLNPTKPLEKPTTGNTKDRGCLFHHNPDSGQLFVINSLISIISKLQGKQKMREVEGNKQEKKF